jgi:hemolysin activation/secretion protein
MKAKSSGILLLAWAGSIALPAVASAQEAGRADPLRERTGPTADPLQAPSYVAPLPDTPTVTSPPTTEPSSTGPTVQLRDVHVVIEGARDFAVPMDSWDPKPDAATDLSLDHNAGEPFSDSWVSRQFARNGLIGSEVAFARILSLVQLINQAFLTNGFANSGVLVAPQPYKAEGILELRLIGGRVIDAKGNTGQADIEWKNGHARGLNREFVEARLPSVANSPFNAIALERDFRSLADQGAIRTVQADLRPGTKPGEATLKLVVDPQVLVDAYVTVANNRSPSVGGERAAVGGSIRNVVAAGDQLSAEAGITDGLKDGTIGYATPFLTPWTTLNLRGAANDAAIVDRPLVPLDIKSQEWSVEGGLSHSLVHSPLLPRLAGTGWVAARNISVGFLFTHRKTKTSLLGMPFSFSPGEVNGGSEYTMLRFTGDWVERGVNQVWAVSLTQSINLEGTRSTVDGTLSPDRHFLVTTAQLSYARRLAKDLELRVRGFGQLANGTLYSGERISVGGENSVRGYRESLLLADDGATGSIELAYSFSLAGDSASPKFDWGAFTFSAFADGAIIKNHDDPQPVARSIASIGPSLTWRPSDAIFARVAYGHALRDLSPTGQRDLQDHGFHFRVTVNPLEFF